MAEGRLAKHETSKQELGDLRRAVNRNLSDAAIATLSSDNRFALAYEAGMLLAKMFIACAGYRAKGLSPHQTTFTALKLAMGSNIENTASYLDRCRRMRNELSYDTAGIVTNAEAVEILEEVKELNNRIEIWINEHYPQYGRG